jgi:hypothetical protein
MAVSRQEVYREQLIIQHLRNARMARTYRYLCMVGGQPTFTHEVVGELLRVLR